MKNQTIAPSNGRHGRSPDPIAAGTRLACVAADAVVWVKCPICADEVGFPPTFAGQVACCPRCAGLVQFAEENRVLWRPALDAANTSSPRAPAPAKDAGGLASVIFALGTGMFGFALGAIVVAAISQPAPPRAAPTNRGDGRPTVDEVPKPINETYRGRPVVGVPMPADDAGLGDDPPVPIQPANDFRLAQGETDALSISWRSSSSIAR
ncbi:MAG TPA: hypothetical protein VGX76_24775 [Pirellulales bacterium]|jgi:hypothetical protein|nr:hypothetical protein [Pirellulales bacterium]